MGGRQPDPGYAVRPVFSFALEIDHVDIEPDPLAVRSVVLDADLQLGVVVLLAPLRFGF